ncbi:hypothetical protein K7J14_08505 [Treponema zuelzerae]|uniref:Uncharacterized protein n=1 Tax=Teretinema zuelzerae TaxID=156 RepID=A0AAE3EHE5_9SPIR|nr:hypothetical protein [Teretinema zuelzerae]MCD1654744.1 hypothetical protein [Teretinema zuelzerae]
MIHIRSVLSSLFIVSLAVFLQSCGIDNYIYLFPVSQQLNNPTDSEDVSAQYFHVRTSDSRNQAEEPDSFRGFEVYYRIYNSSSARNQDIAAISTYYESYDGLIQNWLSNTKKFHRMANSVRVNEYPLIPSASDNREVYIRFTQYTDNVPSRIFVGNLGITSAADQDEQLAGLLTTSFDLGIPLRTNSEGVTDASSDDYLFSYDEIDTDDDDVTYTSSVETDKWHVLALVFAYGTDATYNSIYSPSFTMGSIIITDN